MRTVLTVAVVSGLFACGSNAAKKAIAPTDASVTADASRGGGDPAADADVHVWPEAWPGPDVPPSTCSPATGCADAGTCWQHVTGNYVCGAFEPDPINPAGGGACDGGVPGGALPLGAECCLTHADCQRYRGGRCVSNGYHWAGGAAPPPGAHCRYDWCRDDSDCSPGSTCFPSRWSNDQAPLCIRTPCRTSADCKQGPGGACVWHDEPVPCAGYSQLFVYCQYSNDVCRSDLDCPADAGQYGTCLPRDDGHGTWCRPPRPNLGCGP